MEQQNHPKPSARRAQYERLDGSWQLNKHPIRVPFPPQALASGYIKKVGKQLCYERTFQIPAHFTKERILLHFGAVDQVAKVLVNGQMVGKHEGGYTPFTLDITQFVHREEENLLQVDVTDSLNPAFPYGKQKRRPGGMWYTQVSGIWQSVWLENVPDVYVQEFTLTPSLEDFFVQVKIRDSVPVPVTIRLSLPDGEELEQVLEQGMGKVKVPNPICWSPENPYLYDLKILAGEDEIATYVALRTIETVSINGVMRVCLNGNPIFLHGVLDQGYFPQGIYTPDSAEAYEKDILSMKELGFNFLRKHVKVEPDIFYYYCDLHGMLVMQDLVNSGRYSFLMDTVFPTFGLQHRWEKRCFLPRRRELFRKQMEEIVKTLYNHPCLVAYTIFNEGWGQFDSDHMYDILKSLDATRLIDTTSGWFWREKSDFDSLHVYFKLRKLTPGKRPLFVSECGGFSRKIKGHTWSDKKTYGYGVTEDETHLTNTIVELYEKMILPEIPQGICGSVYTQLSDVEEEINGLYTYDRKVCKVNKESLIELATRLQQAVSGKNVQ